MPNPDRPWPRSESPRAPLDATDSSTLELWCAQPEFDTRSLEEFAAEGGRPMGPPNRTEGGPGIIAGFFAFAWGLPWLAWRAFRWALPRRGAFHPDPPTSLPRAPAPMPPTIRRENRQALRDELPPVYPDLDDSDDEAPVLPRAPIGGTGMTDRHGRTIPPRPTILPPAPPPKNFETGFLRSSLTPNEIRALGGAGGERRIVIAHIRSTIVETPPPPPDSGDTFKR